jgi:hypothetical protein
LRPGINPSPQRELGAQPAWLRPLTISRLMLVVI